MKKEPVKTLMTVEEFRALPLHKRTQYKQLVKYKVQYNDYHGNGDLVECTAIGALQSCGRSETTITAPSGHQYFVSCHGVDAANEIKDLTKCLWGLDNENQIIGIRIVKR